MENNSNKKEKTGFSITLQKETVERIRHVRKVAQMKGHDAYRDLDRTIFKWLLEQEKKYEIGRNDHKTTMFCPQCKSNLKIVHTKNGDFIGCTGYPKCNYTKSLK